MVYEIDPLTGQSWLVTVGTATFWYFWDGLSY